MIVNWYTFFTSDLTDTDPQNKSSVTTVSEEISKNNYISPYLLYTVLTVRVLFFFKQNVVRNFINLHQFIA